MDYTLLSTTILYPRNKIPRFQLSGYYISCSVANTHGKQLGVCNDQIKKNKEEGTTCLSFRKFQIKLSTDWLFPTTDIRFGSVNHVSWKSTDKPQIIINYASFPHLKLEGTVSKCGFK